MLHLFGQLLILPEYVRRCISNCPYTYWAEDSVRRQFVVKTVMNQIASQPLPYSQK